MRTPQLTEQYGQVDRVSVARAILSSLSCATAGVRSNPRREKPAPPTSAPLRKFLRESSIAHPPTISVKPADCNAIAKNYNPTAAYSQTGNPDNLKDETPDPSVACFESKRHNRPMATTAWHAPLPQVWSRIDSPTDPQEFLVLAFLQPYAEFARSQANLHVEGYTSLLCPFCSRKPSVGVLRQQGDGGRRSLLCGFCLTEWEFRRLICAGCGEEDHAKLPVYTAAELPYIRVECCDTCQTYIKTIDLTKNGLADPLVDELASVPLNLWAQEHRYAQLQPNLLGM